MIIKPLGKNSMGIILTLLLVILLSESRLFKFFTDTYLGRTLLVTILLIASYLNKILGIVCVFIIIIMFNINVLKYEGFDTNNKNDGDKKEKTTTEDNNNTTSETTTTNKINTPITTPTPTPKDTKTETHDKINVVTTSTTNEIDKNKTSAIEGFDLQSTENNIKRGKQSNSIPVNQYYKQSIEVAPYEQPGFSNLFGLL
jgi:hypothetical protein